MTALELDVVSTALLDVYDWLVTPFPDVELHEIVNQHKLSPAQRRELLEAIDDLLFVMSALAPLRHT